MTRAREIGLTELPGGAKFLEGTLREVGGPLQFTMQVIGQIPTAIREYPSEIFRYAGVLVRGSGLVILFMLFNSGMLGGLLANNQLEPLGVGNLSGAGITIGLSRGLVELILGWVVAAKIGCGLVAELGSMRINEEVDALEVMGVNPISYLVSTRVLAVFIVTPGLIFAGFWVAYWGGFIVNNQFLQTGSEGAFWNYLWALQNLSDLVAQTIWATLSVALPVLIGCYYGYTATGGPVGVGENTAKSMLVSMTLVALLGAAAALIIYGTNANAPFGN